MNKASVNIFAHVFWPRDRIGIRNIYWEEGHLGRIYMQIYL